jgi:hypothetical protein
MALQAPGPEPAGFVGHLDSPMRVMTRGAGHFTLALPKTNRLLHAVALAHNLKLMVGPVLRRVIEANHHAREAFARPIGKDIPIRSDDSISRELNSCIEMTLITELPLHLLGSARRLENGFPDRIPR